MKRTGWAGQAARAPSCWSSSSPSHKGGLVSKSLTGQIEVSLLPLLKDTGGGGGGGRKSAMKREKEKKERACKQVNMDAGCFSCSIQAGLHALVKGVH